MARTETELSSFIDVRTCTRGKGVLGSRDLVALLLHWSSKAFQDMLAICPLVSCRGVWREFEFGVVVGGASSKSCLGDIGTWLWENCQVTRRITIFSGPDSDGHNEEKLEILSL